MEAPIVQGLPAQFTIRFIITMAHCIFCLSNQSLPDKSPCSCSTPLHKTPGAATPVIRASKTGHMSKKTDINENDLGVLALFMDMSFNSP